MRSPPPLSMASTSSLLIQAKSPGEAYTAVEKDWGDVQANNFPTRARAIAKEIASTKPDFVGLQELSLYRTQTPADFTVHTAIGALAGRDPWAERMPAPQRLPTGLIEHGRTIPVARVAAMHEGKRRARARRADN